VYQAGLNERGGIGGLLCRLCGVRG
jgi:hypothetical protein